MSFNLKNFRVDQLHMSQDVLAKTLGISQDKVSRMENDPNQITLEMLIKIAMTFGMNLDDLVKLPERDLSPLKVNDCWSSAEYIRSTMCDYIKNNTPAGRYKKDVDELEVLVRTTLRKPVVAFIGHSDSGKSTLINALLGKAGMPAKWTPTTAIAAHLKHTKDRPAYMGKDEVWIFHSDDNGTPWDDTRLADEEYCRSLRLCSGNMDLLNTYGTRSGEHFSGSNATAAVAFIESDVLLNADFCDLPGYGTGDRISDDALSLHEKRRADILIYLSPANAFMRGSEINYIRDAITSLPAIEAQSSLAPLANLYILASHAHVVDHGNAESLETILKAGCARVNQCLSESFWLGKRSPDALDKRFFTYTTDIPELRKPFEDDLKALLEALPRVIEENHKNSVRKWAATRDGELQIAIQGYEDLLAEHAKYQAVLDEYLKNEPKRYGAFQQARKQVTDCIDTYRRNSSETLKAFYAETINVDHLTSLIDERKVKRKKEDLELFSNYLSGLLSDKVNAVLQDKAGQMQRDIDTFLKDFDASTHINVDGVSFTLPFFNMKQAFAAGLAGLSAYGALAIWAASCGNLGGYVLVAKGVSLLSALGISVGGTAAAASAVASIGGPIVLGIGIALIAAISAFAAFSGVWKRTAARRITEAFQNERVLSKLTEHMDEYWSSTREAFDAAADSLDEQWKQHLEQLRSTVAEYDEKAIEAARKEAEEMRNFLKNIPL